MSYNMLFFLGIIISLLAQTRVQAAYNRYSKRPTERGYTGYDTARAILDRAGLSSVDIVPISGTLTDNYNPRDKTVYLSQDIYSGSSIASVSVAAHEVGHAIQDSENYSMLRLRSALVPLTNICSNLTWYLILFGLIFQISQLFDLGIIFFMVSLIFQLVTLPVEFNASSRAMKNLESGFISGNEVSGARSMLTAAALTYVASVLVSITNLFRLLILRGNND